MNRLLFIPLLLLFIKPARADFWGGDIPLLAEIVTNTLNTLSELQKQGGLLNDELAGIKDKINRITTITDLVKPADWNKWKDPREAMNRIKMIYHTLPKEYRSAKSDMIESEISNAMNLAARVSSDAQSAFLSGKEMEQRGADASPGVAQKLTASGVGTLISIQSQQQVAQAHVVSLLTQMLAEANEKESRAIESSGATYRGVQESLGEKDRAFSRLVLPLSMGRK